MTHDMTHDATYDTPAIHAYALVMNSPYVLAIGSKYLKVFDKQ
jgi:hypothetical protein